MNDSVIDRVIRHAAGAVSRRGSLRLVGGAALTGALTGPDFVRAGKAGKKVRQVCRKQGSGCDAEARAQCAGNDTCLNAVLPCCALLAQCKGREATECFLSG